MVLHAVREADKLTLLPPYRRSDASAHTSSRLPAAHADVTGRKAQAGSHTQRKRARRTYQSRRGLQALQATGATADTKPAEQQLNIGSNAFDWRNQWYPVHFARDLPEGQPQRVYIFDEPIVLLKRPGDQGVVALRDRCPHRAAALSEGRMMPDGQLQCAYHGWSFDGESGICTNIPQVPQIYP